MLPGRQPAGWRAPRGSHVGSSFPVHGVGVGRGSCFWSFPLLDGLCMEHRHVTQDCAHCLGRALASYSGGTQTNSSREPKGPTCFSCPFEAQPTA